MNDAPTTSVVVLAAISEDSGDRVITQTELLGNAADIDSVSLTATSLTIDSGNGSLIDNGDGTWTYTPALNDDSAVSFSYTVTDGDLTAAGSATLDITPVNDAPVAVDDTANVVRNSSVTIPVLVNDSDVEGDALTPVLVAGAGPSHGTVTVNPDGTITYTPELGYLGPDSFTYQASDGDLLSNEASTTVSVNVLNTAPVAVDDTAQLDEDASVMIAVLGNDQDAELDQLSAELVTGPSHGAVVLNSDGSFTYTPEADYFGDDSFTYTASDGGEVSNIATVSLTITPVNDAPTTAPVVLAALAEDNARVISQAELLSNAADIDSTSLTATGLAITSGNGGLVDNLDGTWTYTPAQDDTTSMSFSYTVTDGYLGITGGATLDLTPLNDAPVAVDDRFVGDEDSIFIGNVLGNDYDVDGDALSVTLLTTVTHGCMMLDADGVFHYRPTSDWFGSDSFTYRISDGLLSADATVTLVVNPVNDAPLSADDSYTLLSGTPLLVTSDLGVLANDSDIDHDPLTAILVSGPTHGSLAFNPDGGFSYSPNTGYTGPDSFTYRTHDGMIAGNLATVSLTVQPDTLKVTAFEPTGSGFDLRFNRAVDAGVLNLYTAADNPMGSADLSLSGPNGTVKGSLILDADRRGASFIQTGGPLAAGDYHLSLASRSDGFKDLAGNLLDGDGDGTSGDDYLANFSIASLGGEARLGIGDLSAGPGQSISVIVSSGLPITLANAAGASHIRFQLAYNPDLLCISGASFGTGISGSADWTSQPGLIVFNLTSASPLSNASTELVRLLGSVPNGNIDRYGAKQLLDLHEVSLGNATGDPLNVRVDDGIHINVYLGDSSGNAGYATLDVQRSQRVNVSLDTGFGAFPLADPRLIGDIDHDGGINVSDAMLLARELKYLSNPTLYASFNRAEIADIPTGVDLLNFLGDDPLVNIPTDLKATAGGLVSVPVMLAAIEPGLDHISLDAVALKLAWDPGQLELVSFGAGNLTGDFLMGNPSRGPGSLTIEMSRLHALDCAYGSLLELQFRVAAGASGTLRVDLVEATLNETHLTLNPAPLAGVDPTDGAIRVIPPVTPPDTPLVVSPAPDSPVIDFTRPAPASSLINFASRYDGFAFKNGDDKGWLGDWLTDSKSRKPNLETLRIQPKLAPKLSARL